MGLTNGIGNESSLPVSILLLVAVTGYASLIGELKLKYAQRITERSGYRPGSEI